jgi:site-specific DNA-adenine methylase
MIELDTHENSAPRYPGSKSRRALRLLRLADQDRRHYVEPFGGRLGLLFRARRERLFRTYHANDVDADLMNFWTVLRDRSDVLIERLWAVYRRYGTGNKELLQKCRAHLVSGNEISRVVAYFVLARLCVKADIRGGMIRSEKRRYAVSPITLEQLPKFSLLLQGVWLNNDHYQHIDMPSDVFAYRDSPYERIGSTLYHHQVELREFSEWARALPASWMLTLNDSPLINMLFCDFDKVVVPVTYETVGYMHQVLEATELVVMNYHRPSRDVRDVLVRQFGWSVRSAQTQSVANEWERSQRSGSEGPVGWHTERQ